MERVSKLTGLLWQFQSNKQMVIRQSQFEEGGQNYCEEQAGGLHLWCAEVLAVQPEVSIGSDICKGDDTALPSPTEDKGRGETPQVWVSAAEKGETGAEEPAYRNGSRTKRCSSRETVGEWKNCPTLKECRSEGRTRAWQEGESETGRENEYVKQKGTKQKVR